MGRHARLSARTPAAALTALHADPRIVHHERRRARRRRSAPLPADLAAPVRAALSASGVQDLHAFQAEAIRAIRSGEHVTLVGGTGAGKTLCYHLPMLEALHAPRNERKQTALYISPTKALAQDQARRLRAFEAPYEPRLYDGDASPKQRAQVRSSAALVLTNPDMLSAGILPRHEEWATFLRGLAVVVLDESHVYRGVFGSHVAHVMRRLRRLLHAYGNEQCTFVLSSATTGNPAQHAAALTGLTLRAISDHGAPQAARDVLIYAPQVDEDGNRDSALGDAARMYAQLVADHVPTIVFTQSRRSCELVHTMASQQLRSQSAHDVAARIAPYRGGYTPQQRRETEAALASGELLGVVATSALELGIDVGSLDACIVVTYPGTATSLAQRWGRAGRASRGTCVLIAGDDALDQYFAREPEVLLSREPEDAVVNIYNERIAHGQLAAAAAELPLTDDEPWPGAWLGEQIGVLEQRALVRRSPRGAAFIGDRSPAHQLSLRSSGIGDVQIIDTSSGLVLGTVDVSRAATHVHPGAVYLHRGASYVVELLDPGALVACVRAADVPYYTMARIDTTIQVTDTLATTPAAASEQARDVHHGMVLVTDQFTGYQRIDTRTHRVLDTIDGTLPPLTFATEAVWWASPMPLPSEPNAAWQLLGSLHAAEHAMIALLPLIATCDRWDIGGLSIDQHPAFAGPGGSFIYDGHPGGVGITAAGHARFAEWTTRTLEALTTCPCSDGCPSCVQSPKCGNLNDPLDKAGAIDVLRATIGVDTT